MLDKTIFDMIMDNAPCLVFVKDSESRFTYANKMVTDLYPPEKRDKIIGHTTVEEFAPEEVALFLAEDKRALDGQNTEIIEEIASFNGPKRIFLTRKIGFTDQHGERRLLGISSDITDLSKREQALTLANQQLESFSAIAAHDLRSPLASYIVALQLVMLDKATSLSDMSRSYIAQVMAGATNLCENIAGLLAVTKVTHEAGEFIKTPTDLNLVIDVVKFNLSAQLTRDKVLLYTSRLPELDVNRGMMTQLFQNLIENSIKYQSNKRQLQLTIRHDVVDDMHRFSIEDNGIGVSPAVAKSAFGLFDQGDTGGIKGGVGIGLSLCRKIVELHSGQIWIEPGAEGGTRVLFTLPHRS